MIDSTSLTPPVVKNCSWLFFICNQMFFYCLHTLKEQNYDDIINILSWLTLNDINHITDVSQETSNDSPFHTLDSDAWWISAIRTGRIWTRLLHILPPTNHENSSWKTHRVTVLTIGLRRRRINVRFSRA